MPTGEAHPVPPDPADLYDALRHALKHGAHAAQLAVHWPALVDLLAPADTTAETGDDQPSGLYVRAYRAEQIIRTGINEVGGESGAALLILFGLTRRTGHKPLDQRRHEAARHLGIQADTLRRAPHEGVLILMLAIEIYGIMRGDNCAKQHDPT